MDIASFTAMLLYLWPLCPLIAAELTSHSWFLSPPNMRKITSQSLTLLLLLHILREVSKHSVQALPSHFWLPELPLLVNLRIYVALSITGCSLAVAGFSFLPLQGILPKTLLTFCPSLGNSCPFSAISSFYACD